MARIRWHWVIMLMLVSFSVARAQRSEAAPKAAGAAAITVYRETFDSGSNHGFSATGYGSAKFLEATMPAARDLKRPEGFSVVLAPGLAGSKGALKIAGEGAKAGTAERYFNWPSDDATILVAFYAHGLLADDGLMLQAWNSTGGKNVHAYIGFSQQDQWLTARVPASSLTGFGGGGVGPGDQMGNLMFVVQFNPAVKDAFVLIDQLLIFRGKDGVPPAKPPTNLVAKTSDEEAGVRLTWTPAEDDLGVYIYEIHRGETADFELTRKSRIGTCTDVKFIDFSPPGEGICHYRIVAVDPGGFKSASASVACKIAPPPTQASGKPLEF